MGDSTRPKVKMKRASCVSKFGIGPLALFGSLAYTIAPSAYMKHLSSLPPPATQLQYQPALTAMHRSTLIEHPAHPPNLMYDNPSSFQVEDFFNLDLLSGTDDAAHSASASSTADTAHVRSGPSSASSSSRASSEARTDSPAASFVNLRTPPQAEALPSFDANGLSIGMGMNFDTSTFGGLPPIEEESIFTLGGTGGGDFFKPGTDPLASLSHAPFDLFASFDSAFGGATSSDVSTSTSASAANSVSSSSNTSNNSSFPFSAINPQLVRTPAPSTSTDSPSDTGAEPDSDDEESRGLVIAPIKVGGKGKARRGTLHSGGVSKKPALPGPQSIFGSLSTTDGPSSSVGKGSAKGAGKSFGKDKGSKDKDQDDDEKDDDLDDWRPSPEEYAKMSSKEKRQLRNKISARNFRIRRKEYIHTLEGDIADRDRLIDAIRVELGSTKSENSALRQEVAALKKAILEGRASPMLPPPAPLSPLSPFSSFASLPGSSSSGANANSSSSSSHNIIKPNTHKDLPTSPRLGASPFWGGQAGGFGSLGGGITPVHTAIIPETATSIFGSGADRQKENINPALNVQLHEQPAQHQVLSQVLSQLYGNSKGSNNNNNNNGLNANNANVHGPQNAFDAFGFADVNPFTLKTLDAYRMQLWGRVAAQAQYAQRSSSYSSNNTGYPSPPHSSPEHSPKPQAAPQNSAGLSGLASSLRPQYFAPTNTNTPTSGMGTTKSFGSLLSGKGLPYAHSAHHGPPTPPSSPQTRPASTPTPTPTRQQQREREQAQTHALLATLASQTVLHKLGSAFWDAFTCSSSSSSSTPRGLATPLRAWDSEKVRRVLDGSAVLRVVDVDRTSSASASASTVSASQTSADALAESMSSLSLGSNAKQERRDDGERKGLLARMSCGGGCNKKQ